MANPEHLQILEQGVEAWNAWRQRVDITSPDLIEADLHHTNLTRANFIYTKLDAVNFYETNLNGANLGGADLSYGQLGETVFGNTNLIDVQGLETCRHNGPSTLDHRTLANSGPLPLAFLRGCGLPDALIDYLPSLLNEPFQFYSCFISYASRDQAFAECLYADLQNKGVRCWFAPEDMKAGDRIRDMIDQQIRLREKLLLILSSASIASTWVEDEVEDRGTIQMSQKRRPIAKSMTKRFANTIHRLGRSEAEPWLRKAAKLTKSAKLLWAQFLDDLQAFQDGQKIEEPFIDSEALMLYGFAIENLLKAGLIARGSAQSGSRNFSLTSHNLIDLSDQLGLPLSDDELVCLEKLEHFITWAGRYPIPLRAEQLYPREMPHGGTSVLYGFDTGAAEAIGLLIDKIKATLPIERTSRTHSHKPLNLLTISFIEHIDLKNN